MTNYHTELISQKRKLGSYYTPSNITQILANWAIRSPNDFILEPSFGGCSFLESSLDRLINLGAEDPIDQLFGCDIDFNAFKHLVVKIGENNTSGKFLHTDFLSLRPDDFSNSCFNVIIGNPPYVSHHNMTLEQKHRAYQAIKFSDFKLQKKASLWAYFVVHSFSFLADNSRFAWILPGGFLQADYAAKLHEIITRYFQRVLAIVVHSRIFLDEGTKEKSVILLADGMNNGPSSYGIEIGEAHTLPELETLINNWQQKKWQGKTLETRFSLAFMDNITLNHFEYLSNDRICLSLGDIADIRIGIVTGANNFFIINEELAKKYCLESQYVKPILAKLATAPGLSLLDKDYINARKLNKRCLLIDTSDLLKKNSPIRKYLATFPRKRRKNILTFKKRVYWHMADDGKVPDAFLSYMYQYGPRLVINKMRLN